MLGGQVLRAGQGITPADVYAAVTAGHPVVAWVAYPWVIQKRQDWVAFDGQTWSGPEWIAKSTFEPVCATYDDMAVILA